MTSILPGYYTMTYTNNTESEQAAPLLQQFAQTQAPL